MNTCICTLYDNNFFAWSKYVKASMQRFAEFNDFKVEIYDKVLDPKYTPAWNKLLVVLDAFKKGYEAALWMDADSIYIHNGVKLEEVLPKGDFICAYDFNGLCTSHMLIRNTAYNKQLLETLLFLGDVKEPMKFGDQRCLWEQNALKALLEYFNLPVTFFDQSLVQHSCHRTINPVSQFLHFGATSNDQRAYMIPAAFITHYKSTCTNSSSSTTPEKKTHLEQPSGCSTTSTTTAALTL